MKAIHGAKAKNDRIDSLKIASLLRGGTFPVAYVYPRAMRSTRDLLRRRLYFVRKRAELLAHLRILNGQYNLPEDLGRIAVAKNREGLGERFSDPAVANSLATRICCSAVAVTTRRRVNPEVAPAAASHPRLLHAMPDQWRTGALGPPED
jgi:hypothetical protein